MPLRLHLTVVRSRPLFWLGLRWFYCHDACTSWCFALVRCFARAAIGEPANLLVPQFSRYMRENAADSRQRTAFIQSGVPLVFTRIRASRQTAPQPANALPCAYSHHLTLCENALAASFAGVVHPLHPLAGIDSARLLLFSGDAISYVSNCRTQSTTFTISTVWRLFLCSTASLLYPCPGWPASAA